VTGFPLTFISILPKLTKYIHKVLRFKLSSSGDHPPITPVGLALPHELHSSDNARIYELVVRHFLATISPDALFQVTRAQFSAPFTKERFTSMGRKKPKRGF